MRYTAYLGEPDTESYQARNPGALKAFSIKHPRTNGGLRIFRSFVDGYQALLYDLETKCAGKSRSKLTPESNLRDLMRVYGFPLPMADFVAKFLRKALQNDSLGADLPLSFFLEE